MPREKKKRGRRAERKGKRKLDADEDIDHFAAEQRSTKRQRASDEGNAYAPPVLSLEEEYEEDESLAPHRPAAPAEAPFVGLLDDEEQEYFKRADTMLELNQFDGPEERSLFLANVYREAEGKELKLAHSQSCSRLLERLILLSTAAQLKSLFQKFSGHFLHLVQHRFASHCCEALFTRSAPIVSTELGRGGSAPDENGDPNAVVESMENMFLHAINELEEWSGYLMTDRFASHALRVLLFVLSGQPLASNSRKHLTQSKRKEHISVNGSDAQDPLVHRRSVPDSFTIALEKLLQGCVLGLDTQYLRALATHKIGSPVLQVLLQIELSHFGKQRAKDENSLIHKLLPDDAMTADSESTVFISNLTYDPVGSHLVEVILEHAPGRLFKSLWKQYFKERLPSLARNDVAGHAAMKALERLGREDLEDAVNSLIPELDKLIEKNRTAVIRAAIERCKVRGVDTGPLAAAVEKACSGPNGFEIAGLLRIKESRPASEATDAPSPPPDAPAPPRSALPTSQNDRVHGSLLAQTMLTVPGPLSELIFASLVKLPKTLVLKMAYDPASSRVIQAALTSEHANVIFRRKMIQSCYGEIGVMALDPSASRVVDAVWNGTGGLAFIRERIAEELAENEASLRQSGVGRHVWRRWEMDLWRRRRGDWVARCRESAGNDGFIGFPEDARPPAAAAIMTAAAAAAPGTPAGSARDRGKGKAAPGASSYHGVGRQKTAIELARERHATEKAKEAAAAERKARHKDRRENGGGAGSTPAQQTAGKVRKTLSGTAQENGSSGSV